MAAPNVAIRGQRSLLRQIREALAGGGPAQTRLDMVVRIIARSMVAEVCSLYMRRAAGDMELFATEGLDPAAVHITRMKPGEGLVGEIMKLGRPLNLADAPEHPAFSYRPETGEDPYHAFLGVPLLRGGRAIGVLVVQNRTARIYTDDEQEDLQIVAMVLAEMVAAGELIGEAALKGVEIAPHRPERLKGSKFGDGLAYGVAVLHEAPVAPSQLLSDDVAAEEARLGAAIDSLQAQIDQMLEGNAGLVDASFEVLDTYRMFAHSQSWLRSLQDAVTNGLTAEAAVERVRSEHRARLGQARDPHLRARLHDLEDLTDPPAFPRDGAKITLLMNAGLDVDLDILGETGAEGIGLFRTEFQFMVAEEMPRFNAQTALYGRVMDAAGDLPVTFRTLDLGGDNVLPYMEAEGAEGHPQEAP